MRAGIIRLNERHGLVETSVRGYFETLTRAWVVLVADARRRSLVTSSAELLATPRARSIFVAPDLLSLPEVP
jgi:hypothetical protein